MANVQLDLVPASEWGIFDSEQIPALIAGPCSAESEEQMFDTAKKLKELGVNIFRAGIWKPRTRPGCFEGIGSEGLPWMRRIQKELGMKITTEVANTKHVYEALKAGMDMLWIGARTSANPFAMQELADALKGVDIPVLVKNPVNPDVDLWIGALERLNLAGIKKLGVIHRGFSTYGKSKYRNQPQWELPVELRRRFPEMMIIVDPSHMAGKRELIPELAQKAMDLGFDGLMVESHNNPDIALSDSKQQYIPTDMKSMVDKLIIRSTKTDNTQFNENLDELRSYIDDLDTDLIQLLSRRMRVAEKIGNYKKQNNITVLQSGRWDDILAKVHKQASDNNLDLEFIDKVFKAIHQASIDRQTQLMSE